MTAMPHVMGHLTSPDMSISIAIAMLQMQRQIMSVGGG